jgi:molybdate transport system substrate-binding protein
MTGIRFGAGHLARLFFLGWALAMAATPSGARADDLLVFAAASLKNALDDAGAAWTKQGGGPVRVAYAASGPLAKQIENGAPADLFISADALWMNALAAKNLLRSGSKIDLLTNSLVLIAPKTSPIQLGLASGAPLAAALGDGRLAIGDPDSVPAGTYAKAALQNLGLWHEVEAKLAEAESVRAALALVARQEAPLGIVYATDAAAEPAVRIVATFPADSHPPIIYPAAILADSRHPEAAPFLAWLRSPVGAANFTRQGFRVQP